MRVLLYFLFFVLCSCVVLGAGTCTLGKDIYYVGETAYLTCRCTLLNEEGITGNIIFKNADNGTILTNYSISSGSCRVNAFIGQRTFVGAMNTTYNGTAYFETSNAAWNNADDNRTDHFIRYIASINECFITELSALTPTLGRDSMITFRVKDSISDHDIVGAYCTAEGRDINNLPLVYEPTDTEFRHSIGDGKVSFSHFMDETFWQTNTSYSFMFRCACPPNATNWEGITCVDRTTGENLGFRSCSQGMPFTTGTEDYRYETVGINGFLVFAIILLPFLLAFLLINAGMYMTEEHSIIKIFLFFMPFLAFLSSGYLATTTLAKYYGFPELQNAFGDIVYWIVLVMIALLSYFFIYMIVVLFRIMMQEKKSKMEY